MKRLDIEKAELEFKNLLSGPAPVGRILNYVYLAGTDGIYHKNGYRSTNRRGQIGSAWATEFIIGLGIFKLGAAFGDKNQLLLTKKGQELFETMQNGSYREFDEGSQSSSIKTVRNQMDLCSKDLYPLFRKIFIESYPFAILKLFLEENGYVYQDRVVFMDDLFEEVKKLYDVDSTPYNRNARTSTASNRVPSLLQLCQLFDMLEDSDGLYFVKRAVEATNGASSEYSKEDLDNAVRNLDLILKDAESIAEHYGEDGTSLVESMVRNSSLQHMFKYNLMLSQNSECVVCGLKHRELLVGSHIKPAAKSNATEKADFNNGLLLCCNHDKLFDRYLITFNFLDGQIEISKTLSDVDIDLLGLDKEYKLPEELLTAERVQYLMEHNIEFREREENR